MSKNDLPKLLSSLPRARLRRRADWLIRFRLYSLLALKRGEKILAAWPRASVWQQGAAVAALVLIILGATSAYAYASPGVLPGNPIYPLKLAVETIERATAITPAAQVAIYDKLSERRLQEAASLSRLAASSSPAARIQVEHDIEETMAAAVNNHQSALLAINDLPGGSAVRATAQVQANSQAEVGYLNQIADYAHQSGSEHDSHDNADLLQRVGEIKHWFKAVVVPPSSPESATTTGLSESSATQSSATDTQLAADESGQHKISENSSEPAKSEVKSESKSKPEESDHYHRRESETPVITDEERHFNDFPTSTSVTASTSSIILSAPIATSSLAASSSVIASSTVIFQQNATSSFAATSSTEEENGINNSRIFRRPSGELKIRNNNDNNDHPQSGSKSDHGQSDQSESESRPESTPIQLIPHLPIDD